MADYKILEKIGQGGMGIVYRALQVSLNRMVAIKFLDGLNINATDRGRFEREIEACTALQHPNIVKIFDSGVTDNRFYYVMEYIRADTLGAIIEKGNYSLKEASSYIRQLLDALAFCHEKGFVHRDVKPGNIMVSKHGHLTLMDFGLVKSNDRSVLTEPGKVLGTPFYFPPELMEGEDLGPAADVWAAGVIFYQMVAKRRPFEAPDIPTLARMIMCDPVPPILEFAPDLPKDHADVITKMLSKPLKDRYANGREALNALQAVSGETMELYSRMIGRPTQKVSPKKKTGLREIELAATNIRDKEKPARPPRRRGLAVLAGMVVAIAVFLAVFLRPRSPGASQSVKLQVDELPGSLRVIWTSSEPYRGRIRVTSPLPPDSAGRSPGTTSTDWEEASPTRDHALWARPLTAREEIDLQVLDAAGEELGRLRVRPQPLEKAGEIFQQKLDDFGPEQILTRIFAEVRNIPLPELPMEGTPRYGPRLERSVQEWMGRIEEAQRRLDLAAITEEFASVKEAYYTSPFVKPAARNRLVMTLQRCHVLEANLKKLGATPELVMHRGSTSRLGPVLRPFEGEARVIIVPIQAIDRKKLLGYFPADECSILASMAKDDIYLVEMSSIHPHQKFVVSSIRDLGRGGQVRSRVDHPGSVQLPPIDSIERLDVGMIGGFEPDQSVRVDINPGNATWEPLALFQGRGESLDLLWYRVDPGVISTSPLFIRLAIETHPPQDPRLVHPKAVVFRYRVREGER